MEKRIRALLLSVLGFKNYLSLVSNIYLRLVSYGFLKKKYPELFYLKEIVKPGFICVDIGANVGYYTVFLSRYAGSSGHVYAVEPVALFADIFTKNTTRFGLPNITLFQTALGSENGSVTMGTPVINGVLRHGLTSIIDPSKSNDMHTYQVPLQIPDELFASLNTIDFLKCDVEGYEVFLFPHLIKTLQRCKPVIQVEISSTENITTMIQLLQPLGYKPAKLSDGSLIPMDPSSAIQYDEGDFYFVL